MKVSIKKLPKSEVEIEGELESEIFEGYFAAALKKIGENVELDGFRKGKVPENVLLSKIPEISILEEMAQLAFNEFYPKILAEEKIDAISRPEISITKLARKNPLGFKIKTAVLPETTLPDYKGIAKKIMTPSGSPLAGGEDLTVSDKELEDTIMDIRKSRAPKMHVATPPENSNLTPDPLLKGGGGSPFPSQGKAGDEVLPELNDEFVQALLSIAQEAKTNPELVRRAPQRMVVDRLDEVKAAREPNLRWTPIKELVQI